MGRLASFSEKKKVELLAKTADWLERLSDTFSGSGLVSALLWRHKMGLGAEIGTKMGHWRLFPKIVQIVRNH